MVVLIEKTVALLLAPLGMGRYRLACTTGASALHMPRARRLFEARWLAVIPAATDHEAVDAVWEIRKLLPDADALDGSGQAIKEWVGLWEGR